MPHQSKSYAPDTSIEADEAQIEVFRQMSPAQRSLLAAQFTEDILDTTIAGIRSRHPHFDDRQIRVELARLTLPRKLFEEAYKQEDDLS